MGLIRLPVEMIEGLTSISLICGVSADDHTRDDIRQREVAVSDIYH